MRVKILPILVLSLVFLNMSLSAGKFELQFSYGGWSLEPISPVIEKESEDMILEEVEQILGPLYAFAGHAANIDFSDSKGKYLSATLWYRFSPRWSAGVRGDYIDLQMPFTFVSTDTLSIPYLGPANVYSTGGGQVDVQGFMVSFLGRWTALDSRRWTLSLTAGLSILPFEGRWSMEGQADIHLPWEEYTEYFLVEEQDFDEVRELYDVPPTVVLSPILGISMQYKLFTHAGLFLEIGFSQGSLLSAGLFFRL